MHGSGVVNSVQFQILKICLLFLYRLNITNFELKFFTPVELNVIYIHDFLL
jgi:hypothetical protein